MKDPARKFDSVRINRIGGVALSWLTIVVQAVLSLFFTPFFLKTVGDRQYGLYSFATSLIAWLTTLLVAITSAYYKFLTREQTKDKETGEKRVDSVFFDIFLILAAATLIVGIGFDTLLFFGAIDLPEYTITEKNQICILILMSVISTFFVTAATTRKNYPYYKQKYIFVYSMDLLSVVLSTGCSFLVLKMGYGVLAVALVHYAISLVFTIITCCYSRFVLKETFLYAFKDKENASQRKALAKEIIVFASFVIVTVIADILHKNLDKTLLGIFNPDSVANYALAYTFVSYLISFTSIVGVVFVKSITKSYYDDGIRAMDEVHLKASKYQTIIACAIVGGFACVGRDFLLLWLDEERPQVFFVALGLLIVYSFSCSRTTANSRRQLLNLHQKTAIMTLVIMVGNIGLSLLFLLLFPKDQAIYACLTGTIIASFIGEWVVLPLYDSLKTKLNVWSFYSFFLLALALGLMGAQIVSRISEMTGLILLPRWAFFVVKVIIFLIFYVFNLAFLDRSLRQETLKAVRKLFKRNNKH